MGASGLEKADFVKLMSTNTHHSRGNSNFDTDPDTSPGEDHVHFFHLTHCGRGNTVYKIDSNC